MKLNRRAVFAIVVLVATTFIAYFLFVPGPLAQPPGPPGQRGAPGFGGPPGVGRGMEPVGSALTWTETPMSEDLQMTYDEFRRKEGLMPVRIPRAFLRDEAGQPRTYSRTEWQQLHNLYREVRPPVELRAVLGSRGGRLVQEVQTQLAVELKEKAAIQKLYAAALDSFWFEIGYPTYVPSQVTTEGVTISLDVLMHVKKSAQRSYGDLINKSLKRFNNIGQKRMPFSFITYQGGYWHPIVFRLSPEAVAEWEWLWPQNQVRLRLLDGNGELITSQTQPAGHSSSTPTQMVYPPEIRLTPEHEYLSTAQRLNFSGGKFRMDYAEGWRYTFQVPLTLRQLILLDKAEAQLIGADGEVHSSTLVRGTRRGPYAGDISLTPPGALGVEAGVAPEAGSPGPGVPPGARRAGPGAQLPPPPPAMPGML